MTRTHHNLFASLALEIPSFEHAVVVEFLASQRAFFVRSPRIKFRSPPLAHEAGWAGCLDLGPNFPAAAPRLQLRVRVPNPGGKDLKSAPVDISFPGARGSGGTACTEGQEQRVALHLRTEGRVVEAKVTVKLTDAAPEDPAAAATAAAALPPPHMHEQANPTAEHVAQSGPASGSGILHMSSMSGPDAMQPDSSSPRDTSGAGPEVSMPLAIEQPVLRTSDIAFGEGTAAHAAAAAAPVPAATEAMAAAGAGPAAAAAHKRPWSLWSLTNLLSSFSGAPRQLPHSPTAAAAAIARASAGPVPHASLHHDDEEAASPMFRSSCPFLPAALGHSFAEEGPRRGSRSGVRGEGGGADGGADRLRAPQDGIGRGSHRSFDDAASAAAAAAAGADDSAAQQQRRAQRSNSAVASSAGSSRGNSQDGSPMHKKPRVAAAGPPGLASFWSLGRHAKVSVAPLAGEGPRPSGGGGGGGRPPSGSGLPPLPPAARAPSFGRAGAADAVAAAAAAAAGASPVRLTAAQLAFAGLLPDAQAGTASPALSAGPSGTRGPSPPRGTPPTSGQSPLLSRRLSGSSRPSSDAVVSGTMAGGGMAWEQATPTRSQPQQQGETGSHASDRQQFAAASGESADGGRHHPNFFQQLVATFSAPTPSRAGSVGASAAGATASSGGAAAAATAGPGPGSEALAAASAPLAAGLTGGASGISEPLRQEISLVIESLDRQLSSGGVGAMGGAGGLGAPPEPSPRRAEFKASLEALLRGDVAGAGACGAQGAADDVARATLDSVLLEIAPFDKGQPLGDGYYLRDLAVRVGEPPPAAAAAVAPAAGPATPAPAPASTPAASVPPASPLGSSVLKRVSSCGAMLTRSTEGLPPTASSAAASATAAAPAPVAGSSAAARTQSGRHRHTQSAASALEGLHVPVRALYAPMDQVAARGESACTCVALEVAAWLEANPSRRMGPATLADLVMRGCSVWRQACEPAAAGAAAGAASARADDSLLGFQAALDVRNRLPAPLPASAPQLGAQHLLPPLPGRPPLPPASVASGGEPERPGCHPLWEVQSAYSQVGPDGPRDPATTFPAFVSAASAAARDAGTARTFVLVARGHSTVASFQPSGGVLLINSLGRSLSPSCKHAHLLEFASTDDFCASYVGMVLPSDAQPAQVEAHRVAASPPAGGEAEIQLYMPT